MISISFQIPAMISVLIKMCQYYLNEEDINSLTKNNITSSGVIYKHKKIVQFLEFKNTTYDHTKIKEEILKNQNCYSSENLSCPKLDFIIIIDLINKFKNLDLLIKDIGFMLKPHGILALNYDKKISSYISKLSQNINDSSLSCPYPDGYVQKLLLSNQFYIQEELDYKSENQRNIEFVLMIAQKKVSLPESIGQDY